MDAYEAIINKRDRRDYDSRPLDDAVVHKILQAGRMAGSSSNSQPLRFIAIKDAAQRQALKAFGRGVSPLDVPLAIIVVKNKGTDFDAGRALQNMFVAAWAEGVISCPVGLMDKAGAGAALGLPAEWEIVIGGGFGYPAPTPPAEAAAREPRPRIPMEELVHWERW